MSHNFSSILGTSKLKMRRIQQILFHILLIWLTFLAFQQHHCVVSSTSQEAKSVSFMVSPAAYNSKITSGSIRKTLRNTREDDEEKVRKTPSGPSPVGNHRPPSRG